MDLAGNAEQPKSQALAVDLTPPITQLVQNGFGITLNSSDADGAGIARIRYLVDYGDPSVCANVAEDMGAPLGTCQNPWYTGPFTLSGGSHTIAYQAFDAVGNVETLQTAHPFVGTPVSGPSVGGMGIGKDPLDTLWSVVNQNSALSLAHLDSVGTPLASAVLQDATSGMPWSVFFDHNGRAYAVGGAQGAATQAGDVAIYKASSAGDAIENRLLFDSGFSNNDYVFDAQNPGWIAGAAQLNGVPDQDGDIALALWRFDPALGTVQLSTTYTRAGVDLGTGLGVDADGSVWIAGFSLNPDAVTDRGFDLSLWHYAADGHTLLGGPFRRPGYLVEPDGGATAKVYLTADAVYVASPRANATGAFDMAFLKFDKATGQVGAESAWHPADGASAYPVAILPEASGLLVVGGTGSDFTRAALWRFGLDGAFQSATSAGAGGAKGAVFRGNELWLSVDGSTAPYRVLTETPADGALIDVKPPRTTLAGGDRSTVVGSTLYVSSASVLGFTTADDRLAAGDGLGVGTTQTFYVADGGAYARFTTAFSFAAEGLHTVSFYSVDLAGNAETPVARTVGVDNTPPAAAFFSSGTLYALTAEDPVVAGTASGVAGIFYAVDVAPESCDGVVPDTAAPRGTCANLDYAGPFELAPGTHTVSYLAVDRVGNEVVNSSFVIVAPKLASIALTPAEASIPAGTTVQFEAVGTFTDGSTLTITGEVAWSADPSTVTTVGTTGLATGLREGEALVIASSGAVTAYAVVTVTPPLLTALVVTPSTASAAAGLAVQFAAAGTFTDGSTRTMTGEVAWSTDLSTVAMVSATGLVTSFLQGTALVTASSGAIVAQAVLTVTPPLLTEIFVTPSTTSVPAGLTVQFAAAGTFTDGSTRTMTTEVAWSADPSTTATVSVTGLATGLREGEARVNASSGTVTARAVVTVTPPLLAAIVVAPSTASVAAGLTVQFVAAGTFTDGSTRTVTGEVAWTTELSTVATLNASGLATSYLEGTTTVTASSGAITAHAVLTVIPPILVSIAVAPSAASIPAGLSVQFAAAGTFTDSSTRTLTGDAVWSIDFASVATVGASGLALAAREGTAIVTSSSGTISGQAILTVTPPVLVSIEVTPSTAAIFTGASFQFTAAGTFTDASTRTLTVEVAWSTDASTVATVDAAGRATGVGAGTTRVSASAGTLAAFSSLTVTPAPVVLASIAVSPASTSAFIGATVRFSATGIFTDGSTRAFASTTGDWQLKAPMGTARTGAAGAYAQGKFFVLGGVSLSSVEAYDPLTDAWTARAAQPVNRSYAKAAEVGGNIYVVGGAINADIGNVTNALWIYDPAADTWTQKASMPTPRILLSLETIDGKLYAAGGQFPTSAVLEVYDPATNAWQTKAPMPSARGRAAAGVIAGKLYMAGGTPATAELLIYDPAANAWTLGPPQPVARAQFGAALDGKLYAMGGESITSTETDIKRTFIYDPAVNAWSQGPLLNEARYIPATASGGGRLFIAGSRFGNVGSTSLEVLGSASELAWSVDVPAVAKVSAAGEATGLSSGTARVIASSGAITGQASFTVIAPVTLASISVTPSTATVLAGATIQFAAAGTFTDGSTRTLTTAVLWSTDVSSVATVSAAGLATGVAAGAARVIASSGAISGFARLTVPVTLASIAVTPAFASIPAGTTAQFEAAGTFTDGSTRTLTAETIWTTQFSSVATVSVLGLATGVAVGETRVLASLGAITGQASLTVTPPPVTLVSISVSPPSTSALIGAVVQFSALGTFTDGSTRAFVAGSGAWESKAPMGTARTGAAGAYANGKFFVLGGVLLSSVEAYDPLTDAWTPRAPQPVNRSYAKAAELDGKIYVVGGAINADIGNVTNALWMYDPAADSWTQKAAMPSPRILLSLEAINGKLYAAGGQFPDSAALEVYDPATNAWQTKAPMPSARGRVAGGVIAGKLYMAGGTPTTAQLLIYDPAANAWTSGPSQPVARAQFGAALDGRLYVMGGESVTGTEQDIKRGYIYDPASGAWSQGPLLNEARYTPATGAGGGKLFIAGSRFNNASSTSLEVLAPAGGVAWSVDAPAVATVTAAGEATALSQGTANVIASFGAIMGQASFTVTAPVTLASIAVTPSTATILPGATIQYAAAGAYTDGSTRTLTGEVLWSTDVSSVASVDAAGLASGVGGGAAHVIAASGAIAGRAALNVSFVATSTVALGSEPELTLVSTAPFSVMIVSTAAGSGATALGVASTQGMVLVGTVYDVTRQDQGATAVLTWSFDPAVVDAATVAIWRFDGIAWSSITVLNQVVSVTGGVGTVTGGVVLTSLYALFTRDVAAPVTTLLVDGLPAEGRSLSIAATSALAFTAADAGAGVLETRYVLDGAAEAVFSVPFSLTAGAHALSYRSVDRAGNMEAARSVEIAVESSDTTPPLARLDFPGAGALGVERAVGGTVDVRGAASDASALTWTLEAAAGAGATTGFSLVASGAGGGPLASWNTAALSGYQTLRLRATDAFGNSASDAATVFVGSPVFTFAVGRKDSNVIVNKLKSPTGIVVRSDGAIWVASTESDKILLISPEGVLLREAGHAPGHSGDEKKHGKKGKDDDGDDDHHGNAGDLFKTPQGLALDAADNLYVTDRDLNRVVKLSPDGQALLLKLGKTDGQGRPESGSGPGELKHPYDVAVDGNGDVYVADSGNRRVQVFSPAGTFLRQFGQGALPSKSEIRGITLTCEGLWVSDKEHERVFLFSREGVLLKSIGDADSVVGELSRMRGLASDRFGALYVVEPNRDRAQKFDPQGKGLLAFGSKDGLSRADKQAKRWLTQPGDAAVAPDGSIWFTDTGRDRIVRYAPPSSGGFGVAAYSGGGEAPSSGPVEPAARLVDAKDGAKVERDDGAGVSIPKDALAADLEITVEKGDENRDKEQKIAKRLELKITAVADEVRYGPEGTTFNTPVTLTLPYDANLLAVRGIKEEDLKVYYWNPGVKDWQVMPSTVDKQNKTVNAQTNHFSAYQVQGPGSGIGVAAVIDDFGLRDQYAFPNPSRGGASITFRIQPGLADAVEVRVYDLVGRKIHASSDFAFRGPIDDGNGKGAQNTYDHVWSVDGAGSGVYRYVIQARRAGQTPIVKSGKVGVIK